MSKRFNITRITKTGGQFAKGKYAVAICHRSGFKFPYKEMVFEPGTNYFVHKSEDDGEDSLVNHPQNFPPGKLTERIALRWAHPDTQLSVGHVASIGELFPLVSIELSIGTATSIRSSIGTGVSAGSSVGEGLYFSTVSNSMYIALIFQGI